MERAGGAGASLVAERVPGRVAVGCGAGEEAEGSVERIGIEPAGNEHALATAAVLSQVRRKTAESTKYRAGAVLVVGGSPGMSGAVALAALAAFRADAGYVTVAAPESCVPALE